MKDPRASLLAVALIALSARPGAAEPATPPAGGNNDITVTASGPGSLENGVATARDNVKLSLDGTDIYADEMSMVLETRDTTATGRVRIYGSEEAYMAGDLLRYNLNTRVLSGDRFRMGAYPVYSQGDALSSRGQGETVAYDAIPGVFTTENNENPGFKIRTSSTTHEPGKNRYVMRNPVFYAGPIPFFWLPILIYHPGGNDVALQFDPGYTSEWGPYLLTAYGFRVADPVTLKLHLDYRALRGFAYGADSRWVYGGRVGESDRGLAGEGEASFYIANDSAPDAGGSSAPGATSYRYRATLQQRLFLDTAHHWYVDAVYHKLSDSRFNRDFFENEFQLERQPDNYAAVTRQDDNTAFTVLGRMQVNSFFETIERLPEVSFEVKRINVIPGFALEYNGETSYGQLVKKEGEEGVPGARDLSYGRFDTRHELSLPLKAGWLSLVPRAGWRGTYYSRTLGRDDTLPSLPNSLDAGSNPSSAEVDQNGVQAPIETVEIRGSGDGGPAFRSVFNLGLEAAFKLSRTWDVQNEAWGIDHVRHVVEPWLNFSYLPNPSISPDRILPIEARLGSTRLAPLNFPQYNSVDTIDNQAIARVGLRQRLQTKRDKRNYQLASFNSWIDFDIERQYYNDKPTSNLFNELEVTPVNWLRFRTFASTDLYGTGYNEYNTQLSWQPVAPVLLNIGTRYIQGSEFFRDNNQVSAGWMVRFNENWSASMRHVYDVTESTLRVQNYGIYRDLSAWRVSVNAERRLNTGAADETLFFVGFTLKAFPQSNLPVGYNPNTTAPITVGGGR